MPVKVPDEPKKYTTVYDNFKGVDYTSDPSNVYRRRSPSGVNMLPDLDGRPHKRTGWGIRFSADDFRRVAGALGNVEVIPKKVHYFSYGSNDYLMIFNTLGVFYTSDADDQLHLAKLATGTADSYTVSDFPPLIDGERIPPDEKRAFFFEGNGIAGFYVFVGSSLFRFGAADDGELFFWYVEPKIPIILIGCDHNCVGTDYEPLNMITDLRTVEYFSDGTSANWALPSVPDPDSVVVEVLDQNGNWTVVPRDSQYYPWEVDGIFVKFTGGKPAASTVGNIRITFSPDGESGGGYTVKYNKKTDAATITSTYTAQYTQTRNVDYTYEYRSTTKKWKLKTTTYGSGSGWTKMYEEVGPCGAALFTPNNYDPNDTVIKADYTGSVQTVSPKKTWFAYNSGLNVAFDGGSISKNYGTLKQSYSSWTKQSESVTATSMSISGSVTIYTKTLTVVQERTRTDTRSKKFNVYALYTAYEQTNANLPAIQSRAAFEVCQKVSTFGNNIYNQVFLSSCMKRDYRNRVWYSASNDPSYFPDINYIEVGADDKTVMGMVKIGQYLGIIKKGSGTDASIYLAYPTSFDEQTTYAVKQSVSGIGAISTGAFNILNEEPLFLSDRGIMGVDVSQNNPDKQIRNRSHFINKKLLAEGNLESAISFVYKGLYYLAINNHCYVLDGSQKTSWANEKTNLQYEAYYLENIPAQCFAKMNDQLYFSDNIGNLCYFKSEYEAYAYADGYQDHADWVSLADPSGGTISVGDLDTEELAEYYLMHNEDGYLIDKDGSLDQEDGRFIVYTKVPPDANDTVIYDGTFYTIIDNTNDVILVSPGVPIKCEWSTIADDDEMVHFFKNLTKKGFVISMLPEGESLVDIYLKPDNREAIYYGRIDTNGEFLPSDIYVRKKVKKYKRLQIICQNNIYNQRFALDQIIKTYTVGNYSKNRK